MPVGATPAARGHRSGTRGPCSSWRAAATSRWPPAGRRRSCGALEITPETHGPRGLGYAELPEPTAPLSARFGPDLIVEEARRRPGEITLVTLGPLTNLAIAVLSEPALPRLLRRWVCMGGAFRVPGNTTPVSEWNVHCDPEAARIALAAWQAAIERGSGDAARRRGWASTSPSRPA